jgi:predicted dehydrogenase
MKNVAIIGFGFMGITHLLNIRKIRTLNPVAIITRDLAGIERKLTTQTGNFSPGELDSRLLEGIRVYASLSDCLRHETLDAVHICVHTDLHYPMTREALESGLHVLLEKPMSLDVAECQELVALARNKQRVLMVGHVLRFMPPYRQLKHWMDTGEFGALKFLSLSRFSGLPAWGQWQEKQRAYGSSGGALFDLLVHDIDFLNYTLGTPQQIDAHYLPGSLSRHDYVTALWTYPGKDLTVKVEGGNIFHTTFPFSAGYTAVFERASVVYSTQQPQVIQVCTPEKRMEIPAGDANEGFSNQIAYFAACLENNTWPDECPPESSAQTIELCYAHLQ